MNTKKPTHKDTDLALQERKLKIQKDTANFVSGCKEKRGWPNLCRAHQY